MRGLQQVDLGNGLEILASDGSRLRVLPGPRGNGIRASFQPTRTRVPAMGAATSVAGRRGRRPRPSTVKLRAMLAKDAAAGVLKDAGHYAEWLGREEPKSSESSRLQTVYRELRGVGGSRRRRRGAPRGSGGVRGRAPHPATVLLRAQLAKDRAAGQIGKPAHYVRWVVDQAKIGIKKARPIVYRELRLARGA